jgi:hypothetical protein
MKPLTELEKSIVTDLRLRLSVLFLELESFFDRVVKGWKNQIGEEAIAAIHNEETEFRRDVANRVLKTIRIAKTRGVEFEQCWSLKVAIEDLSAANCRDFVFAAKIEIDRFIDALRVANANNEAIDIIALVNKLFAECKGSQQAKGKEMANKLTDEQWEAYKKARTGRPITTTREQHFTQRYKNANKPNATKKAKATKKPK